MTSVWVFKNDLQNELTREEYSQRTVCAKVGGWERGRYVQAKAGSEVLSSCRRREEKQEQGKRQG